MIEKILLYMEEIHLHLRILLGPVLTRSRHNLAPLFPMVSGFLSFELLDIDMLYVIYISMNQFFFR